MPAIMKNFCITHVKAAPYPHAKPYRASYPAASFSRLRQVSTLITLEYRL